MADKKFIVDRRTALKTGLAGAAAFAAPSLFIRGAWADDFCNAPKGKDVVFGFNVPQSGAYADEGMDELKAYQLAVKHLNGEGDGGMLKTMKPLALKGNGVLGKKVDVQWIDTKSERASNSSLDTRTAPPAFAASSVRFWLQASRFMPNALP